MVHILEPKSDTRREGSKEVAHMRSRGRKAVGEDVAGGNASKKTVARHQ